MKYLKLLLFTCILTLVSCGGSSVESYQKACNAGDFEKAHSILSDLHNEYTDAMDKNYYDWFSKEGIVDIHSWNECNEGCANVLAKATAYASALEYIFTSEARTIIAGNPSEVDRLVFLYTEIQPVGTKYSQFPGFIGSEEECLQSCYNAYVSAVNSFSNSLLDLAINAGNKRLAAIAVSHFLENYEGTSEEDYSSRTMEVYYSSTDMYAAQEKFDQAVDNGLFD